MMLHYTTYVYTSYDRLLFDTYRMRSSWLLTSGKSWSELDETLSPPYQLAKLRHVRYGARYRQYRSEVVRVVKSLARPLAPTLKRTH